MLIRLRMDNPLEPEVSGEDNNTKPLDNNSDPDERTKEEDTEKKNLNPLRCPFAPRTESMRNNLARNTKRTQRYRSTAQSRLGDMTVGDIRYCFQQLRNAGDNLSSEMILYNGQCAGEFALQYLQETSSATKKRRKNNSRSKDKNREETADNNFTQMNFPSSQLLMDDGINKNEKKNILEF